ncbi:MAG: DUF116 domain-containing protein [Anaerolineales bacterium]|jgi:hypothetical protein
MEIITYSLRGDEDTAEGYYRQIGIFADEVGAEAERRLSWQIARFDANQRSEAIRPERTFSELALEALVLGVLWRVYGAEAVGLGGLPGQMLSGLSKLRNTKACLKPLADPLRGVLGEVFLRSPRPPANRVPPLSLDNLDRLISWLSATGSFVEEAKRLTVWRTHLAGLEQKEAEGAIKAFLDFAQWFEAQSLDALGRYTTHVDRFLVQTYPGYRWRQDSVLCGRRRVEYHLCMVANEILNRVFRSTFLLTTKKVVLLPPCMSAPAERCQARPGAMGEACAGCTPGCRVYQVTKLGEKHGFAVFLLPDELSVFSAGGLQAADNSRTGIVGVSCVLTNPTGGWECLDLGIPAQGVLLDYCGCSWHWHKKGFPTDISLERLFEVMQINHPFWSQKNARRQSKE